MKACVNKLRTEVCERHRRREIVDARIQVFYGTRFRVQKFPFAALVDGDCVISLDPLGNLPVTVDQTGSLLDPPPLGSPRFREHFLPESPVGEAPAGLGPAGRLPARQTERDEEGEVEDADEEELPPGQDPKIIE